MIVYHWSPDTNQESIRKHGLLVPTKHPKLVVPVTCSEGHRNSHISAGKTPMLAWELSGGFLARRRKDLIRLYNKNSLGPIPDLDPKLMLWNLWSINLVENYYRTTGYEYEISQDIKRRNVTYIGIRFIND